MMKKKLIILVLFALFILALGVQANITQEDSQSMGFPPSTIPRNDIIHAFGDFYATVGNFEIGGGFIIVPLSINQGGEINIPVGNFGVGMAEENPKNPALTKNFNNDFSYVVAYTCYEPLWYEAGRVNTVSITPGVGVQIHNDFPQNQLNFLPGDVTCTNPDIIHAVWNEYGMGGNAGDIFIVACGGPSSGTIYTIEILVDGDGNPTVDGEGNPTGRGVLDSFTFDNIYAATPKLIQYRWGGGFTEYEDHFNLAYVTSENKCKVISFQVDETTGIISYPVSGDIQIDNICSNPDMDYLQPEPQLVFPAFPIVYETSDNKCIIETYDAGSLIYSRIIEDCKNPHLDTFYGTFNANIVYQTSDNKGKILKAHIHEQYPEIGWYSEYTIEDFVSYPNIVSVYSNPNDPHNDIFAVVPSSAGEVISFQHDGNDRPDIESTYIVPSVAYPGTVLTGMCDGFDRTDFYGGIYYNYTWFEDGSMVASGRNGPFSADIGEPARNISTYSTTLEGKTYIFECNVFDGEYYYRANSSGVTILPPPNEAPVMNTTRIEPLTAYTDDTLKGYCNATDADNDGITYHHKWFKNGAMVDSGSSGPHTQGVEINVDDYFPLTKDDVFILECKPYDGTDYGDALNSSSNTIQNSPPAMNSSRIAPLTAYANDTLEGYCNATEIDNDNISFNYTWYEDGIEVDSGTYGNIASSGEEVHISDYSILTKNKTYIFECEPYDDDVGRSMNSSGNTIHNTPPVMTINRVALSDRTLGGYCAAIDLNNDILSFNYTWYEDNMEVDSGSKGNVASGVFTLINTFVGKEGYTYLFECLPFDNQDYGLALNSTPTYIREKNAAGRGGGGAFQFSGDYAITFSPDIPETTRVLMLNQYGNIMFDGLVSNAMGLKVVHGVYSFMFTLQDGTERIANALIIDDTEIKLDSTLPEDPLGYKGLKSDAGFFRNLWDWMMRLFGK